MNGDRDGSVTVIDSKTDTVTTVIQPREKGAGRVAASPDGRLVAATHGPEVSVIDVATKQIHADLRISPSDQRPGFPLFSPDSSTLHVMNELSDEYGHIRSQDHETGGRQGAHRWSGVRGRD